MFLDVKRPRIKVSEESAGRHDLFPALAKEVGHDEEEGLGSRRGEWEVMAQVLAGLPGRRSTFALNEGLVSAGRGNAQDSRFKVVQLRENGGKAREPEPEEH